jgi:glutathione S-transferase
VVPTLKIGDKIVTDTIRIVNHINALPGPDLTLGNNAHVQTWMSRIMSLHYGVLLYSGSLESDRTSPTMISRAENLQAMQRTRPELAAVMAKRIAGNTRLQAILKDPDKVAEHIDTARVLVADMSDALENKLFICGNGYSLADSFATAALARFRLHGFEDWWSNGANPNVAPYYAKMIARPSFTKAGVVDTGAEKDL